MASNGTEKLWMSNHATTLHYRKNSFDLLKNGKIQVTKAFNLIEFDLSNIDWTMDPMSSKSWRLYLHSLDWLHALRYSIENIQSVENLHQGLEIVRDWWEFNKSRTQSQAMVWDDHATSNRLANLCFWFVLAKEHGLDYSWLEVIIRRHVEVVNGFFENGHWIPTNHAIFHIASLVNVRIACPNVMLGTVHEDLAQRYLNASMDTLLHLDSGFSVEQSLFYHQFVLDELAPLQEVLSYDDGTDGAPLDNIMEKMRSFIHLISTRSGQVPALGDTTYGFKIKSAYRPSEVHPAGIYDFPSTGLAILRGGDGHNEHIGTFSYPSTRASHGHFSPLHVTLIHGGRKFIVDSGGSYAYGEPFRFSYIISQSAHNVPLLHGSTTKHMAKPILRKSSSNNLVHAQIAREDGDIRRAVWMLENDCFFVMDRIILPTSGTVKIPWHLADDIIITSTNVVDLNYSTNGILLTDSNDHGKIDLCTVDHSISMGWRHSHPSRTRIVSGILEPSPQGWVTKGHRQRTPAPVIVHEFEVEQLVTLTWWSPPGCIIHVMQSGIASFEIETKSGKGYSIKWDEDAPFLSEESK